MTIPDFSHDAPDTLSDYEYVRHFPDYSANVYISAVGGGTIGRTYRDQWWHYAIEGASGKVHVRGSDLRTGNASHFDAAELALTFWNHSED